MLQAKPVLMENGDLRVQIFESKGGEVIWQRTVMPDDASFLVMDIDESIKEIQRLSPPRGGR